MYGVRTTRRGFGDIVGNVAAGGDPFGIGAAIQKYLGRPSTVTPAGISRCADVVRSGNYWWRADCWVYPANDWLTMDQIVKSAPSNVATPPVGPSTIEQETIPGAWTPEQALKQTQEAIQAAGIEQMSKVPVFGDAGTLGVSTTALIGIGLVAGIGLLALSGGGRRR